jgi:acetyl-CoA synthetase
MLRTIGEFAAKRLLADHGLVVPEGVECAPDEAVAAAGRIGYPVTLKVSSDAIAHKTESGGVVLDLRDADAVAAAAARLSALSPRLLVERMHKGAVAELIIGLTGDPQFGTALVIGAGGVLTELLADSATLLLPATNAEIEHALASLKIWRLVTGFRGKHGDAAAVVRAIEAIAAFALANEGLVEELDVNPLLVFPNGAVAVDALIRMRNP